MALHYLPRLPGFALSRWRWFDAPTPLWVDARINSSSSGPWFFVGKHLVRTRYKDYSDPLDDGPTLVHVIRW